VKASERETARQKIKRECQEERRAKFGFAVFVAMRVCDVCMCAFVQVCVDMHVYICVEKRGGRETSVISVDHDCRV